MRHLKSINHLSRKSAHRKAMMANMASSLIISKRIATTEAKAKALRTFVEPLITRSKEDTTQNRRLVFTYLRNKVAVAELFREVSVAVAERPGGYTRILKTGNRLGDNASMCIIELVDFNENMLEAEQKESKGRSRRRRGSKKRGGEAAATATAVAEAATEEQAKGSEGTQAATDLQTEESVADTEAATEEQAEASATDAGGVAEAETDSEATPDAQDKSPDDQSAAAGTDEPAGDKAEDDAEKREDKE